MSIERPSVNDTPESWAHYFALKASEAVARGDERTARQYARWSVTEIRFGELVAESDRLHEETAHGGER